MNALVLITGKLQTLYKGAKTVFTRNGRIVELKNDLRNIDKSLSDRYHDFGEAVYKALKSGESPELDGAVSEIDGLVNNYNSTVDELDRLQNVIRCEHCGAMLKPGYSFCPICGSKAPAPLSKNTVCPECGQSNDSNGTYCTHCGKPLRKTADKALANESEAKEEKTDA